MQEPTFESVFGMSVLLLYASHTKPTWQITCVIFRCVSLRASFFQRLGTKLFDEIKSFSFSFFNFKPSRYTTGKLGVWTLLNIHTGAFANPIRSFCGFKIVAAANHNGGCTRRACMHGALLCSDLKLVIWHLCNMITASIANLLFIWHLCNMITASIANLHGSRWHSNLTLFLCSLSLAFSTSLCRTKRGNLQFPPLPHSGPQRRHSKYVHYDASIASR